MKFSFSREQEDLRRTVRDFLKQHSGRDALHQLADSGPSFDREVWSRMASELGVQGLAVPEEFGGAGVGELETTIVLEEMGYALYSGPYLSTLLGTRVLGGADESVRAELLPSVADGQEILTVAVLDEGGDWRNPGNRTTADPTEGGFIITGRKLNVTDPVAATKLLVWASTTDGASWFLVDARDPGLTREQGEPLDLTREMAHVRLEGVQAQMVVPSSGAARVLAALNDAAAVALAAEMVGGAAAALQQAVDWSKERHQFGRPIGSFQAIKHRCADALVEVEVARVLTHYAAWSLSEGTFDSSAVASMANQAAADAFAQSAGSNIQIHGGIGFTWEHPAHLYFRRAKASGVLFGSASDHRDRVADTLNV